MTFLPFFSLILSSVDTTNLSPQRFPHTSLVCFNSAKEHKNSQSFGGFFWLFLPLFVWFFFLPMGFSMFLTKAANNLVLNGCLMSWYKASSGGEKRWEEAGGTVPFNSGVELLHHSVTTDFCFLYIRGIFMAAKALLCAMQGHQDPGYECKQCTVKSVV